MPHFELIFFRYLNDQRQKLYRFRTATGTLVSESQDILGLLKAQQDAHKQVQQSLTCTFLLFFERWFKKYVICRLLRYFEVENTTSLQKSLYNTNFGHRLNFSTKSFTRNHRNTKKNHSKKYFFTNNLYTYEKISILIKK